MAQLPRGTLARRVILITLSVNLMLAVIKYFAGTMAGSSALVAQAFHSGGDVLAGALILVALFFSNRPPDSSHHYGHRKIESIVAVCVAGLLFFIGYELVVSTMANLREGAAAVPERIAIYITLFCIGCKELMYRYAVFMGKRLKNLTLIADAWHHRTDSLILAGVLIGIVGARIGYPVMDLLVGLIISVLILRMAVGIAWKGLGDLIDPAPTEEELEKIRQVIMEIPGVQKLQKLKARRNGHLYYLELRIGVFEDLKVREGHGIASKVKKKIIHNFEDIEDVIIHINPIGSGLTEKTN